MSGKRDLNITVFEGVIRVLAMRSCEGCEIFVWGLLNRMNLVLGIEMALRRISTSSIGLYRDLEEFRVPSKSLLKLPQTLPLYIGCGTWKKSEVNFLV